ncbi:hypothetical protein [Streptomyces sp. ME19-01-6]|uniref:hypothetical protein n=1 Tax=Streptomyces sp. ME19-01-6 TaxID=3028686 RepID=UPI0029BA6464|nr:hypothetical protein [Streptomyces sp. ME19-01-6]MDX3232540.1 hypothetical protein [Streptomyces sp. ME19-01-6]
MTAAGSDLYARAVPIFGKTHLGGVAWPYGVADPDRSHYRKDDSPARYKEALRDRRAAQRVVTEWAERFGLKQSEAGCCPVWLQRSVSRRCVPERCTHYGNSDPDRRWLDHLTSWTKAGKPAVLTSAPYQVSKDDEARLAWWTQEDSRLCLARGTGWYGFDTTQIVMWRSDLIATVDPA